MASTHENEVGYYYVKTTVVKTIAQLDQSLSELLSTISYNLTKTWRPIVALDIEQDYYTQDYSKCRVTKRVAIVKLCYDTTCLMIQLLQIKEPPCSLAEFLEMQELSFVGVGIEHLLDALSRDYGLKCRNAIDLGMLAANIKDKKYESFGLLDLAYELRVMTRGSWIWQKESVLGSWGAAVLSSHQIEAATWGAFLCYCVGEHLIRGTGYTIIEDS